MAKTSEKILVLILLVCGVTFALLQLRCFPKNTPQGRNSKLRRSCNSLRGSSFVLMVGWDYEPEESVELRLAMNSVKYVLMVPHKLKSKFESPSVAGLTSRDQEELLKLTKFLDMHADYDGATGTTAQKRGQGFDKARESLHQSACRFLVKNWTMIIRNFGNIHLDANDESQSGWYQECNIVEGAIILRKDVFLSLRWRADCGSMSHLDFFRAIKRSLENCQIIKLCLLFRTHLR